MMETKKTGLEKYGSWIKEGKNLQARYFPSIKTKKHHGPSKTFREITYRDKPIKIETTYKIVIDGKPLMAHTEVLNNGKVHCHLLPNYSFNSALDLAKQLVDRSYTFLPQRDELSKYTKRKPRKTQKSRKTPRTIRSKKKARR